jgi:hypothetical protein
MRPNEGRNAGTAVKCLSSSKFQTLIDRFAEVDSNLPKGVHHVQSEV